MITPIKTTTFFSTEVMKLQFGFCERCSSQRLCKGGNPVLIPSILLCNIMERDDSITPLQTHVNPLLGEMSFDPEK